MGKRIAASLLILSLTLPSFGDEAPITLSVSPAHQFEPGTIVLRIIVPKHFQNAVLCFGYDSGSNLRRSCQTLEGQHSPRFFQQDYRNLFAGSYIASAQLYRVPNRLAGESLAPFTVLDR